MELIIMTFYLNFTENSCGTTSNKARRGSRVTITRQDLLLALTHSEEWKRLINNTSKNPTTKIKKYPEFPSSFIFEIPIKERVGEYYLSFP